ncbi:SDR family NAD(P)-dependent oxidoreductase [Rhodobacteraceae bacterium RKSG542]|uniref:SDR family NAD(P)-dependent oxidoreductase n=1 Tax=Pseudovibrio flavus TaxID=2529854 RepID=UPI0012BC4444|nr:SDR family NAD(P)-dependent oxidoreductase [Pseudovibrio flavus]MTI16252.1 SDR family NAD(P)-dependent oxidoreductase [Pseudovibrio flavus]
MAKTILITGATDGIGLETAKKLAGMGHNLLIHGRNPAKLEAAAEQIKEQGGDGELSTYVADLSRLPEVVSLTDAVSSSHTSLDVLLNNAGVYKTPQTRTEDGFDTRFMVNTIAPYLLTERLLPLLGSKGRVIGLSSAAQAPVSLNALKGKEPLSDGAAYAQSKLALTMWTSALAENLKGNGPMLISVNPGSLLASKMVKDAFGVAGSDLSIGAGILCKAALSDEFANAHGKYFDNDSGRFAAPHPAGQDEAKAQAVLEAVQAIIEDRLGPNA